MKASIIALLAGVALGAGAVLGYIAIKGPDPRLAANQQEIDALKKKADQLRADLKDAQARISSLEQMNRELTDRLQVADKQLADKGSSTNAAPVAAAPPQPNFFRGGGRMGTQMRLEALKIRLHLRPDQIAQLDAIVAKLTQNGTQFNGNTMAQIEKELQAILDPGQQQQLAKMDQQQADMGKEMRANFMLSQMSTVLDLNEQQKDKLYQQIYTMQDQPQQAAPGAQPQPSATGNPMLDPLVPYLTPQQQDDLKKYWESIGNIARNRGNQANQGNQGGQPANQPGNQPQANPQSQPR